MRMRRRVRRHFDVERDIVDLATYIARDSLETALRFMDSTEATLKWLLKRPGVGSRRDFGEPALANVRSWAVKGFRNHLILYEIEQGGIYVLGVLHGARDLPRVLRRRVK
jgi:plasmid stabilization system protein ParE